MAQQNPPELRNGTHTQIYWHIYLTSDVFQFLPLNRTFLLLARFFFVWSCELTVRQTSETPAIMQIKELLMIFEALP